MAFPELPDDRRARPRRYRGSDAPSAEPVGRGRRARDDRTDEPAPGRHGASRRSEGTEQDMAQEQDFLLGAALQRGVPARYGATAPDPEGESVEDRPLSGRSRRSNGDPGSGRHGAVSGHGYSDGGGHSNGNGRLDDNGSAPPGGGPDDGYTGNGRPANGRPGNGNGHAGAGRDDGNGHAVDGAAGRRSGERVRDSYAFDGTGPDTGPRRRPPREQRPPGNARPSGIDDSGPAANGGEPRRRRRVDAVPPSLPDDLAPPARPARRPRSDDAAPPLGAASGSHRAALRALGPDASVSPASPGPQDFGTQGAGSPSTALNGNRRTGRRREQAPYDETAYVDKPSSGRGAGDPGPPHTDVEDPRPRRRGPDPGAPPPYADGPPPYADGPPPYADGPAPRRRGQEPTGPRSYTDAEPSRRRAEDPPRPPVDERRRARRDVDEPTRARTRPGPADPGPGHRPDAGRPAHPDPVRTEDAPDNAGPGETRAGRRRLPPGAASRNGAGVRPAPMPPEAQDAPGGRTARVRRDPDRGRWPPVPTRPVSPPAEATAANGDGGDLDDARDTTALPSRRHRAAPPRFGRGRTGVPPAGRSDVDGTAPARDPVRGRDPEPGDQPGPAALAGPPGHDDPESTAVIGDADGPRAGKRSGPVGIAGKITALTSRRAKSGGGDDGGGGDGGKRQMSFWKELPLLVGVALVLTFLIQTFVAKVFVIPSGSMETTLHGCTGCTNDRVLVDKVTYNFTDITPGDVVVFKGPPSWADSEDGTETTTDPVLRGLQTAGSLVGFAPPDETDFVKRVIAVGGQTVACCDALNQMMVDGQPLDEPYIYYLPEAGPARQIPFGPITVPQGEMWMMGDSRNNSADSRASGHGPVPEENVIGKVRLIVLPFDRFGWVDAVDPQTTRTAAGPGGSDGLPAGAPLALGMMGAFPLALGRRRSLRRRAEDERFLPVTRHRDRWRRRS